jgi:hypothetical protein
MDKKLVLGIEQGGYALHLLRQPSGYLELVYSARNTKARCLGIFEKFAEATAEFHGHAANLRFIGELGAA